MLLEKIRRFGFASFQTPNKNAHKCENGLGVKVPHWYAKEIAKLAKTEEVLDDAGSLMAYSTADLISQDPEFANTGVAAYLDKRSARQVSCQIALLTRLRSIYSTNAEKDFRTKISKATRNSKKVEDVWEKRPQWWDDTTINHNHLLLTRLHDHGFFNVLSDVSGLRSSSSSSGRGTRTC